MRHLPAILLALILTATASAVTVNLTLEVTPAQVAAAQAATAVANVGVDEYNADIERNQARIDAQNAQRTARNVEIEAENAANEGEDGYPLPLLEMLPDDERTPRDRYTAQTLLLERINQQIERWREEQARNERQNMRIDQLWRDASDSTRAAVRQLLIDGA